MTEHILSLCLLWVDEICGELFEWVCELPCHHSFYVFTGTIGVPKGSRDICKSQTCVWRGLLVLCIGVVGGAFPRWRPNNLLRAFIF